MFQKTHGLGRCMLYTLTQKLESTGTLSRRLLRREALGFLRKEVQLAEGVWGGSLSFAFDELHYHTAELPVIIIMKVTNIYLTLTLCQLLLQIAYFVVVQTYILGIVTIFILQRKKQRSRFEDKCLMIV